MRDNMKEFLSKLADLIEEYHIEIEQNYEFIDHIHVRPYLDFDLQESPYTNITFYDIYIDCADIRAKLNESSD